MANKISTFIQITAISILTSTQVIAGDVKMYNAPPSAQEMGNLLFSKKAAPKVKTRSISFGKSKPVAAEEPQQQELAASADTVGLPIKFGYNSTQIMPESKPFLDEVGNMLTLDEFSSEKLVIEGHTDAAGSDKYNRYLSERRAESVKNYLANNFQIAEDRLFVTGKGESAPLEGTNPYDGVNRRVQFYRAP